MIKLTDKEFYCNMPVDIFKQTVLKDFIDFFKQYL